MASFDNRPIGVFDSGVGGLTVLKALLTALPRESTVYLGDTARVPYGTKSAEVVTRYSLNNADKLLEHDIKALVVACNTASSVALPALRANLKVPVLGVIEPGASAAVAASKSGHVAVIGTPGTIASGAYQRAITALLPSAKVTAQACPLLVPLAEEGWLEGDVPRLIVERYLRPILSGIDTLVLGCTHYPLLSPVLAQVAGPHVALVDSAEATARETSALLRDLGLLADSAVRPTRRYLVTDTPTRFCEVGARFLGEPLTDAVQVDLRFR